MSSILITALFAGLISGLLSFVGTALSNYLNRKTSKETYILQKQNQVYDLFKYALDLTEKKEKSSNIKGISMLEELLKNKFLQDDDKNIIDCVYTQITKQVIKR